MKKQSVLAVNWIFKTMPLFHYTARNKQGESLKGTIQATTRQEVAQQLSKTGIMPIEIDFAKEPSQNILTHLLWNHPPTLSDKVIFSYQMYTLIKAGVPLIRAMRGLAKSVYNRRLSAALSDISNNLEIGQELSTALSHHPSIFSNMYVNMVRIGENTGHLSDAFFRIAKYFELEKNTREQIKTGLRYPVTVIIVIIIAIAILSVKTIPVFAKVFAQAKIELPWQTRLIIEISDFMVVYWPILLATNLIISVIVILGLYSNWGRYQWDKYKLRLPIFGLIMTRGILGRYARALSVALASGVPLISALTDAAGAVDNAYLSEQILQMRHSIECGQTFTHTVQASGLFTPLILEMIEVGEETGKIDTLLSEVADFYEHEVEQTIKNMAVLIEPILFAGLSVIVLILAFGVFLPMWDLMSVYKR